MILRPVVSARIPNATARTASETIAERIRAQIATGRVRPGEMLPSETALLEMYDVARSTMREALRILESDGLVTIERGTKGGARVQEPDVASLARRVGLHLQLRGAELTDLVDFQAVIQPRAAGLAAAARTDDDLAHLRSAVERVANSANVDEYVAAFGSLVKALLAASHNPVMALFTELTRELWREGLKAFMEKIDAPARYSKTFFTSSAATYSALVDLIEEGDADGAEAFWRDYMEETGAARRPKAAPLRVYPTRVSRLGRVRVVVQ